MLAQRARVLARGRAGQQLSFAARSPLLVRNSSAHSGTDAEPMFVGAEDNEFNRERHRAKEHASKSGEMWWKIFIYGAVPCLFLSGVNAKLRWDAHWAHWEKEIIRRPLHTRPQYEYLNIRRKPFFWGDGDHTLFWNDKVNWKPPRNEV